MSVCSDDGVITQRRMILTCNVSSIPAVTALFASAKTPMQSVEAMANSKALIQNFMFYYFARGWIEMIYFLKFVFSLKPSLSDLRSQFTLPNSQMSILC